MFTLYQIKEIKATQMINNTISIKLQESDGINMADNWEAVITIINENSNTLSDTVNKYSPMCTFAIKDSLAVKCQIKFTIGDYFANDTVLYAPYSNTIIPILSNNKTIPFRGKVVSARGAHLPINQAIVVIGESVIRTDVKGIFDMKVNKNNMGDGLIRIIKNGYRLYEGKIKEQGSYRLLPNEDFNFSNRVQEIINRMREGRNMNYKGKVYSIDASGDKFGSSKAFLCFTEDSILGYMYYMKTFNSISKKEDSYFLVEARICDEKSFKGHLTDCANNMVDIEGELTNDNKFNGDVLEGGRKIGYFDFEE